MDRPYALLAAFFALTLAGCDRDLASDKKLSTTIKIEQELPPGAERQIERAGAVMDDLTVSAKVKAALIREPDLPALSINVDTTENVVTLSGTVQSQEVSARAERAARAVEGVKQVRNKLAVKRS